MDDLVMIFLQCLLWVLCVTWVLITLIVFSVHSLDGWREWQVQRQNRRNGFEVLPAGDPQDADVRQA